MWRKVRCLNKEKEQKRSLPSGYQEIESPTNLRSVGKET
ncbi:hypothetical protein JCM19238_3633 [Vibrio ponticus]|nr:hypothetical protein JCM19238_3633 [Vibrio ponticus]